MWCYCTLETSTCLTRGWDINLAGITWRCVLWHHQRLDQAQVSVFSARRYEKTSSFLLLLLLNSCCCCCCCCDQWNVIIVIVTVGINTVIAVFVCPRDTARITLNQQDWDSFRCLNSFQCWQYQNYVTQQRLWKSWATCKLLLID